MIKLSRPLSKLTPYYAKLAYVSVTISILSAAAAWVLVILESTQDTSLLAQVRRRGVLLCGIEGTFHRFSEVTDELRHPPNYEDYYYEAQGFDADFCRVIAIAVFGDETKVYFYRLDSANRFPPVRNNLVDIAFRNTTWTAGRDAGEGIDFGPVIFYDGQKFLARKDSGIDDLAKVAGHKVCVTPGTTTHDNLKVKFGTSIEYIIDRNRISFRSSTDAMRNAFFDGICDVMTADETNLISIPRVEIDHEDYVIFPSQAISYEPLAPYFKAGDSQWGDIVRTAIWTTIYAEEIGLNRANISIFNSSDPVYQRFLGDSPDTYSVGEDLGLSPDFTRNIIVKVGNYADIFDRNLGSVISNRGPNQVGLLYSRQTREWVVPENAGRLISPPWAPRLKT